MAACTHCGAPVQEDTDSCAYCGTRLDVIDEHLGHRILNEVGVIRQAVAGGNSALDRGGSDPVVAIVRATGAAVISGDHGLRITGIGDVSLNHVALIDDAGGLVWASQDAEEWFDELFDSEED